MNAGRGPASAGQPVAARAMPRGFPRTPTGVRVSFPGLSLLPHIHSGLPRKYPAPLTRSYVPANPIIPTPQSFPF